MLFITIMGEFSAGIFVVAVRNIHAHVEQQRLNGWDCDEQRMGIKGQIFGKEVIGTAIRN
jgi:hypothetical protein